MNKLDFRPPSAMEVMPYKIIGTLNDTITKARLRVFYLGENANGSFITQEFAEELVKTIPYCPTKGVYDKESGDFLGHEGKDRGRIYGVVPENPNLTWEEVQEPDGTIRTYACVDVYLYTGIYEEAKSIIGKAQSMELIPESIEGEWTIQNGIPVYSYKKASFLGLQILGDDRYPCFPDSGFFESGQDKSIGDAITYLFTKITEMEENMNKEKDGVEEPIVETPLADEQILPETPAEEPGLAATEEATDLAIDEPTPEEPAAEEPATEEPIAEEPVAEELPDTSESEIVELTERVTTLMAENELLSAEKSEMESELSTLREFKKNIELKDKEAVIAKYESRLDTSVIDEYKTRIDEFTVEALAKELAFHLVESNAEFALSNNVAYTMTEESQEESSSLESYLLSRRNRKK